MPKPIVLVPACIKAFDDYEWHSVATRYIDSVVVGADATPLILPAIGAAADIDSVLDRVDGILLTGSKSNVHPTLYGATPSAAHEPYDPARDETTLPMIRRAVALGIPLLAICRGFQELNVAFGGTLDTEIQEQDGRLDHRAPVADDPDERFAPRHPIRIVDGSCLGRIVEASTIDVNSLHRQGINRLAPGLVAEAVADDGTIEAIRVVHATSFAVGVQWHPEYWVRTEAASVRLFRAFGEAMRERIAGRTRAIAAE
jgi:putative glutamine amidotransferase